MPEFRVLATAGEAYRFLFREIGTILRLCWLAVLLITVIKVFLLVMVLGAVSQMTGDVLGSVRTPAGLFGWMLFWTVSALGTAIVAVALHRVILFGERRPGQYFYLHFGRAEALFAVLPLIAGFAFAVILLMMLLLLPYWALPVFMLYAVATIYLVMRCCMVFPLIVVEGRWDFEQAWQLTRFHFWRLFAIWLLVMLPSSIFFSILWRLIAFGTLAIDPDEFAHYGIDTPTLIALSVLQLVSWIVYGALGVAALSYSYKALNGRGADEVLTPQS